MNLSSAWPTPPTSRFSGLPTPIVLTMAMLVFAAGDTAGQSAEELSGLESCSACTIALDRVITLTMGDGPGGFAPLSAVASASDERIMVASPWFDGQVAVYGPHGRFRRAFGRKGQGPGEFEGRVEMVALPDDSLMVISIATGRYSIFEPALTLARTGRLAPRLYDVTPADEGRIVVSAAFPTSESALPAPMAVVDAAGDVIMRFGTPETRPNNLEELLRVVAVDQDGKVWAISPRSYVLELWGSDGSKLGAWNRRAAWIRPEQSARSTKEGFRPPTRVLDANVDESGRLWVFAATADDDWDAGRRMDPDYRPPVEEMFDTVVDVYDLEGQAS